jgi:hypothetical protein
MAECDWGCVAATRYDASNTVLKTLVRRHWIKHCNDTFDASDALSICESFAELFSRIFIGLGRGADSSAARIAKWIFGEAGRIFL